MRYLLVGILLFALVALAGDEANRAPATTPMSAARLKKQLSPLLNKQPLTRGKCLSILLDAVVAMSRASDSGIGAWTTDQLADASSTVAECRLINARTRELEYAGHWVHGRLEAGQRERLGGVYVALLNEEVGKYNQLADDYNKLRDGYLALQSAHRSAKSGLSSEVARPVVAPGNVWSPRPYYDPYFQGPSSAPVPQQRSLHCITNNFGGIIVTNCN